MLELDGVVVPVAECPLVRLVLLFFEAWALPIGPVGLNEFLEAEAEF